MALLLYQLLKGKVLQYERDNQKQESGDQRIVNKHQLCAHYVARCYHNCLNLKSVQATIMALRFGKTHAYIQTALAQQVQGLQESTYSCITYHKILLLIVPNWCMIFHMTIKLAASCFESTFYFQKKMTLSFHFIVPYCLCSSSQGKLFIQFCSLQSKDLFQARRKHGCHGCLSTHKYF